MERPEVVDPLKEEEQQPIFRQTPVEEPEPIDTQTEDAFSVRGLAEKRLGAEGSREIERLRVEEESKERELDLLERRIELEEQRYQTQQRDLDPQPEGLSQADKEFLQRGFEQGLSEVERRIGESEARTQQQIKEHAERVATRQAEQAEQQGQPDQSK